MTSVFCTDPILEQLHGIICVMELIHRMTIEDYEKILKLCVSVEEVLFTYLVAPGNRYTEEFAGTLSMGLINGVLLTEPEIRNFLPTWASLKASGRQIDLDYVYALFSLPFLFDVGPYVHSDAVASVPGFSFKRLREIVVRAVNVVKFRVTKTELIGLMPFPILSHWVLDPQSRRIVRRITRIDGLTVSEGLLAYAPEPEFGDTNPYRVIKFNTKDFINMVMCDIPGNRFVRKYVSYLFNGGKMFGIKKDCRLAAFLVAIGMWNPEWKGKRSSAYSNRKQSIRFCHCIAYRSGSHELVGVAIQGSPDNNESVILTCGTDSISDEANVNKVLELLYRNLCESLKGKTKVVLPIRGNLTPQIQQILQLSRREDRRSLVEIDDTISESYFSKHYFGYGEGKIVLYGFSRKRKRRRKRRSGPTRIGVRRPLVQVIRRSIPTHPDVSFPIPPLPPIPPPPPGRVASQSIMRFPLPPIPQGRVASQPVVRFPLPPIPVGFPFQPIVGPPTPPMSEYDFEEPLTLFGSVDDLVGYLSPGDELFPSSESYYDGPQSPIVDPDLVRPQKIRAIDYGHTYQLPVASPTVSMGIGTNPTTPPMTVSVGVGTADIPTLPFFDLHRGQLNTGTGYDLKLALIRSGPRYSNITGGRSKPDLVICRQAAAEKLYGHKKMVPLWLDQEYERGRRERRKFGN